MDLTGHIIMDWSLTVGPIGCIIMDWNLTVDLTGRIIMDCQPYSGSDWSYCYGLSAL